MEALLNKVHKVVIIGSGPAAHTAAIYTGRALLEPIIFEGEMAAGVAAGGQLTTTTDVENFPGFPEGIMGPDLMINMRQQSLNCGAQILTRTVDKVDFSQDIFNITTRDGVYKAQTVIIATGATAKRLGAPGEETYWQKGVSACAVCDGALPMFRNRPLVVIGGGDSACEEADYLSKYASEVILLVRKNEMRASKVMQQRVENNPKIKIEWETTLAEIKGENFVSSVDVLNVKTKAIRNIPANGVFYAIGHKPNTDFLEGQLETDTEGYLIIEPGSSRTKIAGVFACGDVSDKVYRQAITAAGTGCMAGLEAERYLSHIAVAQTA